MATIKELNRKRSKVAPEASITYPDAIEVRYKRLLLSIVDDMRNELVSRLEPIVMRYDAISDVRMIETIDDLDIILTENTNRSEWVRGIAETAEGVSEHNAGQLQSVLTIDPRGAADQAEIDAFVRENVDLITKFTDSARDRMRERVTRAIREGTNGKELREIIQRSFGVSESRARLIARDQIGKLNGQLNRNRQTRAGVTQYKWLTVADERVRGRKIRNGKIVGRGRHWQLHGKIFSWSNAPQVSTDGRHGHPGDDYQCRCQAIPVIDFDTINESEQAKENETRSTSAPTSAPLERTRMRTPAPRPRARPQTQRIKPKEKPKPIPNYVLDPEIATRLRLGRRVIDIARDLKITERTVLRIAERLGLSHLT